MSLANALPPSDPLSLSLLANPHLAMFLQQQYQHHQQQFISSSCPIFAPTLQYPQFHHPSTLFPPMNGSSPSSSSSSSTSSSSMGEHEQQLELAKSMEQQQQQQQQQTLERLVRELNSAGADVCSLLGANPFLSGPLLQHNLATLHYGLAALTANGQMMMDFQGHERRNRGIEEESPRARTQFAIRAAEEQHLESISRNKLGRSYNPGRPLGMLDRQKILDLYQKGLKISHIAKVIGVTHSCVSKIMTRYRRTGSMHPRSAQLHNNAININSSRRGPQQYALINGANAPLQRRTDMELHDEALPSAFRRIVSKGPQNISMKEEEEHWEDSASKLQPMSNELVVTPR